MENPSHCDFVKLRTMLVRTHMQDLKDVTRETHYENYRTQCIQSMTRMVVKERNRKYGAGSGAGLWEGMGQPLFSLGWHWGGLSLLAGEVGGDPFSPRALGPEQSEQLVPRLCPQCPPDSWYLHPLQNPQNSRGDPKK